MPDPNFDSELVRQIYHVVLFKHYGGYSHEIADTWNLQQYYLYRSSLYLTENSVSFTGTNRLVLFGKEFKC
jgi:hypothetical protein